MRILYCISDHGLGHATRAIPVIHELQRRGHTVVVRNSTAKKILLQEVTVEFIEQRNDIGVIQKKFSYDVDIKATKKAIATWMNSWNGDVACLKGIIRKRNIAFVIADSAPQPHIAAKAMGIPSVFLGSFTWIDIYRDINVLTKRQDARMSAAYSQALCGIIMPFCQECNGIRKKYPVNLIARTPRKMIPHIPNSIFYSIGGSMTGVKEWQAKEFTGTMILSSFIKHSPARKTRKTDARIPSIEYVNAVDLIVGKSGYSLAAEAIRCRKPMLLIPRNGFNDDAIVTKTIKRLGIGRSITEEDLPRLINNDVFAAMKTMRVKYQQLPARYRKDGSRSTVKIIERIARQYIVPYHAKETADSIAS